MRRFNRDFQLAKNQIKEDVIGDAIIIKSLTRGLRLQLDGLMILGIATGF